METDLDASPFRQFERWFDEAKAAQPELPEACTVATAALDGVVSARVCLLKGFDARGFVFFTNYNSRKGHELEANPEAALVFYWPEQERQVCIAGRVSRVPVEESQAYFKSRPRGSQIGAWASDQSTPVKDRTELEQKWDEA